MRLFDKPLQSTRVICGVPPETGNGREDFCRRACAVIDFYAGEEGRIFAQLMAEAQSDALLPEAFRNGLSLNVATVIEIWTRGFARGEFRNDVHVYAAMGMIFAPAIYRLLASHALLTGALAEYLLDAALSGFA